MRSGGLVRQVQIGIYLPPRVPWLPSSAPPASMACLRLGPTSCTVVQLYMLFRLFQVLATLMHANHLETEYNAGPHTISGGWGGREQRLWVGAAALAFAASALRAFALLAKQWLRALCPGCACHQGAVTHRCALLYLCTLALCWGRPPRGPHRLGAWGSRLVDRRDLTSSAVCLPCCCPQCLACCCCCCLQYVTTLVLPAEYLTPLLPCCCPQCLACAPPTALVSAPLACCIFLNQFLDPPDFCGVA